MQKVIEAMRKESSRTKRNIQDLPPATVYTIDIHFAVDYYLYEE